MLEYSKITVRSIISFLACGTCANHSKKKHREKMSEIRKKIGKDEKRRKTHQKIRNGKGRKLVKIHTSWIKGVCLES